MKKFRRLKAWILILLLTGGVLALVVKLLPRERLLIEDAFAAGRVRDWWHLPHERPVSYEWITNNQLFTFREQESVRQPYLLSPSTKEIQSLKALEKQMERTSRMREYVLDLDLWELSPDHQWLLWTAIGDNSIHAARIDGSQYRRWKLPEHTGDSQIEQLGWQSDSQHWQAEQGNFRGQPNRSHSGDLQMPKKVQPASGAVWDEGFLHSRPAADLMTEFEKRLVKQIGLPKKTTIQFIKERHDNVRQRVAMFVRYDRKGRHSLLARLLPESQRGDKPRWELWICNPDATACRFAGVIPGKYAESALPGIQDLLIPHALRWLPDGKRISFLYDGTFYIVPVD